MNLGRTIDKIHRRIVRVERSIAIVLGCVMVLIDIIAVSASALGRFNIPQNQIPVYALFLIVGGTLILGKAIWK